jgi:hypothetical protein
MTIPAEQGKRHPLERLTIINKMVVNLIFSFPDNTTAKNIAA